MSEKDTNISKLVNGLDELYAEFKISGDMKSDNFLAIRKLGTLQEHLNGQVIHFNGCDEVEGIFLVVSLSCRRPSSHQVCRIFAHDRAQNIVLEKPNPVDFLENLTMTTSKGTKDLSRSDFAVFEKPIFSWVESEIKSIQEKSKADFIEEKERLSVYYSKQFEELKNKKKSVFFHNYFFEKEARIKEDMKQNHSEMKEQESLLTLRYQPQFQIDVLLCGSLSK